MIYDRLMRLPLLGWVALCIVAQLTAFNQLVNTRSLSFVYAMQMGMRLSTIVFVLLIAAGAILRTRPSTKASGVEPRISALVGSFLIYGVLLFPRRDLSLTAEIASTLMVMTGSIGAIVALSQLGRSFSVMTETRQLVTRGPYQFVRHPLYVAEEIAIVGVWIQFASLWTALLLAAQFAFQLRRIHNEETILAATFPEYHAYQKNTARLVPGIY